MNKPINSCIITATTPNFVQWTMVMIHSFIATNGWFKGDIIVVCDDLPDELKTDLGIFKQLKMVSPSAKLKKKLDELCAALPKFSNLFARFYSFEAFRMTGYDKVLFLDSDMIFLDSIEEVFELPDPFYACPESCWYAGLGRRMSSYEKISLPEDAPDFISLPVNSGFMLLSPAMTNPGIYNKLVDMIIPDVWISRKTFHADQLLINLYFNKLITRLDSSYNYRSKDSLEIKKIDHVAFEDIKVLHFFRWYKPWRFDEVLHTSGNDFNMIKAYQLWYQCYIEFLKFYHLQLKIHAIKRP
jgi:lipopolysaccharide biosynthesis glycosyltransferase